MTGSGKADEQSSTSNKDHGFHSTEVMGKIWLYTKGHNGKRPKTSKLVVVHHLLAYPFRDHHSKSAFH